MEKVIMEEVIHDYINILKEELDGLIVMINENNIEYCEHSILGDLASIGQDISFVQDVVCGLVDSPDKEEDEEEEVS